MEALIDHRWRSLQARPLSGKAFWRRLRSRSLPRREKIISAAQNVRIARELLRRQKHSRSSARMSAATEAAKLIFHTDDGSAWIKVALRKSAWKWISILKRS